MIKVILFTLLLAVAQSREQGHGKQSLIFPYTWSCVEGNCVKQLLSVSDANATQTHTQTSLKVCMLQCSPYAGLWPRPRHIVKSNVIVPVNANSISISSNTGSKTLGDKTANMVREISTRFSDTLTALDSDAVSAKSRSNRDVEEVEVTPEERRRHGHVPRRSLEVMLLIEHPEVVSVTLDVDESYKLSLNQTADGRITGEISCGTYFGCRNGLETLSQLIVFDFVTGGLVVPKEVEIEDRPAYPYRGILLDTARNYVSMSVLLQVIDAMAANKLNTFHWHITDSHSFPFASRSYPQLTQYGAYSPEKIYTEGDISNLVEYARVRGVRVVPELDAPAHVGEGWQWADQHQATVCFRAEPWQKYCVEPPCGQINPTSDFAYQVLRGIYLDMERLFDSDLFHMGGDEVNMNCWNTTESITHWMAERNLTSDLDGLHQLWNVFQERALRQLDSVSKEPHKIVLWTSSLTEKGRVDKFLDKSRYIIQIWTTGKDEIIAELVNKGFQVIFSNYDALYFDCGFGAWVGEGNNWCSPYIGWQKVYENKPLSMLHNLSVDTSNDDIRKLVLGQEATLWTEQADDQVIEQRLWPRAAAMAERLWADPEEGWKAAEHRFLHHRERMVTRGYSADAVEPLWCLQNQGHCYL